PPPPLGSHAYALHSLHLKGWPMLWSVGVLSAWMGLSLAVSNETTLLCSGCSSPLALLPSHTPINNILNRGSSQGSNQPAISAVPTRPSQALLQPYMTAAGTSAAPARTAPSKNLLILMSDTGGGHKASAQALQDAFDTLYPGTWNTSIVDIWTDYGGFPFNGVVGYYKFLGKRPNLWRFGYHFTRFPVSRKITEVWSKLVSFKGFTQCFEEYEPDLVISVHPLCHYIPHRVMKKMGNGQRQIPFVTVVTDLGSAHPTWFDGNLDGTYVPTDVLAKRARKKGVRPQNIKLTGLPTRQEFWQNQALSKESAREELGLKTGIKTALIVGGGDGVGKITEIATATAARLGADMEESQVVVVCGKNEATKAALDAHVWPANVHAKVLGFTKEMDKLMGASDLIVTKAGPGTIAEASIRGLPIILSSYLPGQEKGNVPYVVKGGFGAFERRPRKIAKLVSKYLRDEDKLAEMGSKALAAGKPDATLKIALDIMQVALLQIAN
ncbi:unnamed protein product, partial [Chrysoparadoxa australica]